MDSELRRLRSELESRKAEMEDERRAMMGLPKEDIRALAEIPLLARILAVADTYDAMKADRPYRPGRTMEFILEEFRRCSGTQFDPKVVEAFLNTLNLNSFNQPRGARGKPIILKTSVGHGWTRINADKTISYCL